MKIEILGTGCAKCNTLAEHAETAAKNLGRDYELIKITDMNRFIAYGVMITPAMVVNGEVLVSGKVPSCEEIEKLLQNQYFL
ncbi:thioredoxin family protein [Chitinivibrio alkaliphilus]|uniref:Redox-active disulfide protein 2 n=1 Tax=Chitinivibrio alkaliphilus ACht1 TaxID=1313304 RepID=U7D4Y1_9BACT|nr:thioredoxin family protein [Chitinivibrio alkaliphilus]ERP30998.1 redox-active disulfide protein 2 [Chitinivibrio alkaliphilus ACht1]